MVFLLTGNDVISKPPPGDATGHYDKFVLEESNDFPIVFYCNFASIMHRFIYIVVLLLTGNDVIQKLTPEGAVDN